MTDVDSTSQACRAESTQALSWLAADLGCDAFPKPGAARSERAAFPIQRSTKKWVRRLGTHLGLTAFRFRKNEELYLKIFSVCKDRDPFSLSLIFSETRTILLPRKVITSHVYRWLHFYRYYSSALLVNTKCAASYYCPEIPNFLFWPARTNMEGAGGRRGSTRVYTQLAVSGSNPAVLHVRFCCWLFTRAPLSCCEN